jgi:hypothetical protein
VKVSVYIPLRHTREMRWWGIAPLILNLGTISWQMVCLIQLPLYHQQQLNVTHSTGGRVHPRTSLDNSKKQNNSWPYWNSNTRSTSPYPSHQTDLSIVGGHQETSLYMLQLPSETHFSSSLFFC